jgi:hypothetical protein
MVHRDILVNGKPCAYSEIRIIISEQVANVRYFSLEVPVPPCIAFYKNVTENIYRHDNSAAGERNTFPSL